MGGDLFEILFVLAFILFGILGGRKKKPDTRTRRPPAARPGPQRRSPRRRERVQRAGQDAILRELEALLGGRRPEPTAPRPAPMPTDLVPDPDEARSLETFEVEETDAWDEGLERTPGTATWAEGADRRAATLETLESAGEASHERFHKRYELSAPARVTRRQGPDFDLQDVRRAVVWAEILGPPVSLR